VRGCAYRWNVTTVTRRLTNTVVRDWWIDAAVGVVAAAFLALVTRHVPVGPHRHPLDAVGYVLLAAAGLSMAWLRRRPLQVLVVAAIVLSVFVARDYPNGPVWLTGPVALFALSWRSGRRIAFVGAAALLVDLLIVDTIAGEQILVLPLFYTGWAAAVIFAGDVLRNRRQHVLQLQERARYLERTREEETRRRLAEERLRIARDLHDSVAHAMATINVQAGAAAHVVDRTPSAAKDALTAIRHASSDVLDELTAMLALLRDGEVDRRPTPTIGDIPRLVDEVRARTGLVVWLRLDGPIASFPAAVSMASYRIVQESLTNVVRHAGPATARVTVHATDSGELEIEIADDGAGAASGMPSTGSGAGILGMRERAESTGGQLSAGRAADRGFTVRATWGPT
jgi:signal transduction histidine kinase